MADEKCDIVNSGRIANQRPMPAPCKKKQGATDQTQTEQSIEPNYDLKLPWWPCELLDGQLPRALSVELIQDLSLLAVHFHPHPLDHANRHCWRASGPRSKMAGQNRIVTSILHKLTPRTSLNGDGELGGWSLRMCGAAVTQRRPPLLALKTMKNGLQLIII